MQFLLPLHTRIVMTPQEDGKGKACGQRHGLQSFTTQQKLVVTHNTTVPCKLAD